MWISALRAPRQALPLPHATQHQQNCRATAAPDTRQARQPPPPPPGAGVAAGLLAAAALLLASPQPAAAENVRLEDVDSPTLQAGAQQGCMLGARWAGPCMHAAPHTTCQQFELLHLPLVPCRLAGGHRGPPGGGGALLPDLCVGAWGACAQGCADHWARRSRRPAPLLAPTPRPADLLNEDPASARCDCAKLLRVHAPSLRSSCAPQAPDAAPAAPCSSLRAAPTATWATCTSSRASQHRRLRTTAGRWR